MTLLLPKNFFEPQSVLVATSELFILSYICILLSSSLVVPLQHVCSAFLDIPEVIPPTKLRPSVNYKLECRIHERNPVQFRFVQSPWIALTTRVWSPALIYSWIYEAKPEIFPKLPQITLPWRTKGILFLCLYIWMYQSRYSQGWKYKIILWPALKSTVELWIPDCAQLLPVCIYCSLVPRPSPAPVFAYCKRSKTGAREGLGTRLDILYLPCTQEPWYEANIVQGCLYRDT